MSTKGKTDSEFSPVSFGEMSVKFGRLVTDILLNSWSSFQGNLFDPFFRSGKRHNFANIKKLPVQTLYFSCLKFLSRQVRFTVKILEDFMEGNSRKSKP